VDGASIRIGRRSADMDAVLCRLHARSACLLGADNPGSRRMPAGWNVRARARLHASLRRVPTRAAIGAWRGWSEAHLLAALPLARGRVLARRFRQNAIVVLRRGAPARLVDLRPAADRVEPSRGRGVRVGGC
jgi:hypothetical protein